jgi:peroxiredoxin
MPGAMQNVGCLPAATPRKVEMLEQIQNLNEELRRLTRAVDLPPEVVETIAQSILEAGRAVTGLRIGQTAPDFALLNQHQRVVTLSERLAKGPTVVCFLRGEWCPYCMLEMRALRAIWPLVNGRGASLICVHPQRVEVSSRFAEGSGIDECSDETQEVLAGFQVRFPLSNGLMRAYRASFGLDLSQLNANGQWNLPVPATFVIDQDGVIKARQFCPDFRVRVEPGYILQALDRLPRSSLEFTAPSFLDDVDCAAFGHAQELA